MTGILTKEEMDVMINGFSDSMRGNIDDDIKMLQTYGPKLNEILTDRTVKVIDNEKIKGEDYLNKFLLVNSKAVKTSSGMVYSETLAGTGTQVRFTLIDATIVYHFNQSVAYHDIGQFGFNGARALSRHSYRRHRIR